MGRLKKENISIDYEKYENVRIENLSQYVMKNFQKRYKKANEKQTGQNRS